MEDIRYANLSDLLIERWFRLRQEKKLLWKTKEGKDMPIDEMTDQHLENAIDCLYKLYGEDFGELLSAV